MATASRAVFLRSLVFNTEIFIALKSKVHIRRSMSSSPRPSHDERTSSEPRSSDLHRVTLAEVEKINDNIRCYRLEAQSTIKVRNQPLLEKPFQIATIDSNFRVHSSYQANG